MFRKSVILLLATIIIFSGQSVFAATNYPIGADQIIIAEPTTERMTNDKQVYVTVNITNTKVTENPIIVSLVRIEKRLPFAEQLGSDLNVSVMRLSSSSVGELSRSTLYNMDYNTNSQQYSANYSKEIQVINRLFELKDLISTQNYEISSINRAYRFDLITGNSEEISKLTTEAYGAYKKWWQLRYSVLDLKKEFAQVQIQYSRYFEKQIMLDNINTLSYFKVVGKLSNGSYKLRFIDNSSQLIKEFSFEVIDKEETMKLINPYIFNN